MCSGRGGDQKHRTGSLVSLITLSMLGLRTVLGAARGLTKHTTHTHTQNTRIYSPAPPAPTTHPISRGGGCAARSGCARLNRGTIWFCFCAQNHSPTTGALARRTHTRTARAPAFHRARGRPRDLCPHTWQHTHSRCLSASSCLRTEHCDGKTSQSKSNTREESG